MSKINGFVELDSTYVSEQCENMIAFIKKERQEFKDKLVNSYIKRHSEPSMWQRIMRIIPVPIDYDEAIKRMDEESKDDFWGITLQYRVDNYWKETEDEVKEVLQSAKISDKILINTHMASMISRKTNKEK